MSSENLLQDGDGSSVRERLIAAGRGILESGDTSILQAGISPDRLARAAGVSRRAFYLQFEDKLEFLRAVAASYATQTGFMVGLDGVEATRDFRGGDIEATILAAIDTFWEHRKDDPVPHIRRALFHLGFMDPEIAELATVAQKESIPDFSALITALFDEWNVELRPPWTVEKLVVMWDSLTVGLTIRHQFQPKMTTGILSTTICALLPVILRFNDAPIEPVDVLQAKQHWNLELDRRLRAEHDEAELQDLRHRVATAAHHVVSSNGYVGTTFEAIASEAGLPVSAIRAAGSVPHQICSCAAVVLRPLGDEFRFDADSKLFDPHDVADRHAKRLLAVAADHHRLLSAYVCVVLDNPDDQRVQAVRAELVAPYSAFADANPGITMPDLFSTLHAELS